MHITEIPPRPLFIVFIYFLIAMEVKILAAIEDIRESQRHQNQQLMSIINYLKVEDEGTDLPNDINIPLQTMDALDQLEDTLNDTVKLNVLVRPTNC